MLKLKHLPKCHSGKVFLLFIKLCNMNILASQDHLCLPDNENILVVPQALAAKLGYIPAAIVNQIHYWTKRCGKDYLTVENYTHNPDDWKTEEIDVHFEDNPDGFYSLRWVYNSVKEWTKQFAGFTYWQVRNGLEHLRKLGVLMFAQFGKSSFKRYGWYAINYPRLEELMGASQSIVETPEILTPLDVRPTTSRDASHHQSSYITETNSEINIIINNSVVEAAIVSNLEELREEKQIINSSADNKNQDLSVKPITPHEDQEFRPAPRPVKAQPQQEIIDPDISVKQKMIEGMGMVFNPRLKGILANFTIEQIIKGIASYLHTTECLGRSPENRAGFIIDAIKNSYIENTEKWINASEEGRKLIMFFAAGTAWGIESLRSFEATIALGEYLYHEEFRFEIEYCDRRKDEMGWEYVLDGMKQTQDSKINQ